LVDEAVKISDHVWDAVILPTTADHNASIILASTPAAHKRTFVYQQYFMKGLQHVDNYACWTYPTYSNPMPGIAAWCKQIRPILPEAVWRREIEAEFGDGEGSVFANIVANLTARQSQPTDVLGHRLVAISVIDTELQEEVHIDRFNKSSYVEQVGWVLNIVRDWGVSTLLAESNSMGDTAIDMLRHNNNTDCAIVPFFTDNSSKRVIIEDLVVAFEKQTHRWQDNIIWRAELEQYELTITKSGAIRYAAPPGEDKHDDTVMARALALHAAKSSILSYGFA
jgi:hypothetical protein